jgi:hypothetical protein
MRFSSLSGVIVASALASALFAPSANASILFGSNSSLSTYTNHTGFDSFAAVGAPNVQYVDDNIKVEVTGTLNGVSSSSSGIKAYYPVNLAGTVTAGLNDGSWFNAISVDAGVSRSFGASPSVSYDFHERVYYDVGGSHLIADFDSYNAVFGGFTSYEVLASQGEQITGIELAVTPAASGGFFLTNQANFIQLDNIRINDPTPLTGGVPEPTSWALPCAIGARTWPRPSSRAFDY